MPSTRLGFAAQLKFLTRRGRFPKLRLELPPDAVELVAKQVGVAAAELGFYDFTSRAAKRHRSELRDLTGWHECTTTDQVKLASQLVDVIRHDERREEQVRAELMRQMREDLIEPPTAAQINTVIRSALHQADERAIAEVAARLTREEDCPRRLDALVFTDPTGDNTAKDDEDDALDPATELADTLAGAARRLAGALNAGLPADGFDLGVVARIPVVLAARARQAAPAAQALHGIPDHRSKVPAVAVVDLATDPTPSRAKVQAPPPEPSRDDSVPSSPQPAGTPAMTAPARRKRLSQKAARAVADSARLFKDADHRDTHRWNLIAEDGTVLGHVEPSYGGTGRTGRNGWNYHLADSPAVSGPYKTREDATLQCALAWIRVATAPLRRTLTVD
ncbi:DUF4158 domain-containing protein [Streptomyces colonosanans]|uniref:DUF4158 domain-containing protein n=1 Tax=Streptomyces colonosanans TaxID=1428652 RepID=A0A1S2NUI0_9ACTN|nr:DUF4158 domain-containing protein [Streptomyces colonosanans]OIJ85218.1 hypothetical protein BIV24_29050 [Streptomyces colonosanans]